MPRKKVVIKETVVNKKGKSKVKKTVLRVFPITLSHYAGDGQLIKRIQYC